MAQHEESAFTYDTLGRRYTVKHVTSKSIGHKQFERLLHTFVEKLLSRICMNLLSL